MGVINRTTSCSNQNNLPKNDESELNQDPKYWTRTLKISDNLVTIQIKNHTVKHFFAKLAAIKIPSIFINDFNTII